MSKIPKGQCRYCALSCYQGDNYAVCTSEKHMGMVVKKTSKHRACEDFDFNPYDVFSPDFGDELREYELPSPN